MEERELEKIREILDAEGVIIFPTETVYGIGADPFKKNALKKIYNIKKRDKRKPLTLHIATPLDIYKFAYVKKDAILIIENFLPGPLTIILPKRRNIPRYMVSGKKKIGFRTPSCKVTLEIIRSYGRPIAATSVNISGESPLNDLEEIEKKFGNMVDYIVKERCVLSRKASTVLDFTTFPYRILREGEITKEDIERVLKKEVRL